MGIGGLGARPRHTLCTAEVALDVFVAPVGGEPEKVGTVAPGTPFVRVARPDEATLQILPLSRDGVSANDKTVWTVPADASLSCHKEGEPPRGEGPKGDKPKLAPAVVR